MPCTYFLKVCGLRRVIMSYYNLEQTLEVFQKNLPETLLPFGLPQLADLCRRGEVTPVFPYNRYVIEGFIDDYGQPIHLRENTKSFNGYLTLPDLSNLIFQLTETVATSNAYIYEEIGEENTGAFVSLEKGAYDYDDQRNERNYYNSLSSGETHYIGINNLLFPIEQVQAYIASKRTDKLDKPAPIGTFGTPALTQCEPKTDRERVIELEKELAEVKAELKEYKDVPTDDKDLAPNSQAKVACMLYAILKTHDYDLSPPMGKGLANDLIVNASQVQGTPVTKNFVAEWLKRANQAKINCSKK